MSRRRRALLMLSAAIGAGVLAVSLVGGYSNSLVESYGALRAVQVLTRGLAPGQVITPEVAASSLETRRVPARFIPVGALEEPGPAIGMKVAAPLPAGSYLTAPGLKPPGAGKNRKPTVGPGRHEVEISVSGAGVLNGSGKVDVLVTSEGDRGRGTTRVVARKVPLIAIGRSGQSESGPGLTTVTLGLTRRQAIMLVHAESFARKITVLPLKVG